MFYYNLVLLVCASINTFYVNNTNNSTSKCVHKRQDNNNGQCSAFSEDFNSQSNLFTYDGPVIFVDGKMKFGIKQGNTQDSNTKVVIGYGSLIKSTQKYLYGEFTVKMKSARIGGVVTSITLMSDSKDEIDWEWVGKSETQVQTNYYKDGIIDYTKGAYHDTGFNTHAEFHEYKIIWTSEKLSWLLNGKEIRSVNKADTFSKEHNKYMFPSTSSNINFSIWDGGAGAEGTRDWAGGFINWNDPELKSNNGVMYAEVDSISYKCL